MDNGALVLFSGGQDSATCLAWALDRFAPVETIGFDYGQRLTPDNPIGGTDIRENIAGLGPQRRRPRMLSDPDQ